MNKKLIKQLRNGEICIELKYTDGRHKKKLNKVLEKAFPDDGFISNAKVKYYLRGYRAKTEWRIKETRPNNLKPVKLKKFFK